MKTNYSAVRSVCRPLEAKGGDYRKLALLLDELCSAIEFEDRELAQQLLDESSVIEALVWGLDDDSEPLVRGLMMLWQLRIEANDMIEHVSSREPDESFCLA
jgi:hypothetical protein